ncbi:MAG: YesL family protein [Acidobacteria bacterium]|nr:YesL family protein [Acidobacteriota bacterium]
MNIMLAVSNLPLLVFSAASNDPTAAWPFFVVLAVTVGPSIAGAMGAFRAMQDGSTEPVRDFWRAYAQTFRRGTALGALTLATLGMCLADLSFLAGSSVGALATPLLCVIAATAVAAGFTALAGSVLYPQLRLWRLVGLSLYVTVRYWYFGLLSLACLGGIALAVLAQPVLGACLAPSILLFVSWSNAHFAFVTTATRVPAGPVLTDDRSKTSR